MDEILQFELTIHAKKVIYRRKISLEWIRKVLKSSHKVIKDRADHDLKHYLGIIFEFDSRILHIVINYKASPIKVVTAYFDRSMKGKL